MVLCAFILMPLINAGVRPLFQLRSFRGGRVGGRFTRQRSEGNRRRLEGKRRRMERATDDEWGGEPTAVGR